MTVFIKGEEMNIEETSHVMERQRFHLRDEMWFSKKNSNGSRVSFYLMLKESKWGQAKLALVENANTLKQLCWNIFSTNTWSPSPLHHHPKNTPKIPEDAIWINPAVSSLLRPILVPHLSNQPLHCFFVFIICLFVCLFCPILVPCMPNQPLHCWS